MTNSLEDPRAQLRRSVYLLLIFLGMGGLLGRMFAVESVDKIALEDYRLKKVTEKLDRARKTYEAKGLEGERLEAELAKFADNEGLKQFAELRRPFLSANDRSRWCTLRALVEDDLRVEGHPYSIDNVIDEPKWDTIDMVKHGGHLGHLYSSKPPLFPTMLAGEYWLIHRATGMTLGTHPYWVGRFILITVNGTAMLVFFFLLARLVERYGTTDWGRIFVMGAGVFGTFLTTFAVTINNHTPAAVSAMIAIYAAMRICCDGERRWRYFIAAGLFAAFAAANELPALAFLAALSALLLWKSPGRTILVYVPAALVVVAAFFGTNWLAHESYLPPYLHRNTETGLCADDDNDADEANDNWYDYTYQRNGKTYESYWNNPVGVDRGEPSARVYAMNILVGHHGVFSLTPVWLLSVVGGLLWLCNRREPDLRKVAALIAIVSMVCMAFYLTRPLMYRNYGGVTSGLRWMFWFAPLWLLIMLPAADMVGRWRFTRIVALVLLAASVLSAAYPTWNPWTHPWLMNYWHYLGWIA
ncbi:MAG: hypothetical protein V3R99_14285 [Thermoguttaceae bacterium]